LTPADKAEFIRAVLAVRLLESNVNQAEFSRRTGMSQPRVSRFLHGECGPLGLSDFLSICWALDLDPAGVLTVCNCKKPVVEGEK
jgi:DNA-binding Xre family transcriptional regulator